MNNTKTALAYNLIKDEIISMEMRPKQQIREIELSEHLQLSRTPVREAIAQLIAEGFIEETQTKFNMVAPMSVQRFVQIYQVREQLEDLSIYLAAFNWTDEGKIEDLRCLLENQLKLADQQDLDTKGFLSADRQFHRGLSELSGNALLQGELSRVLDLYYRYNYFAIFKNRTHETTADHIDILNAVQLHDGRRARNLMKRHLHIIRESILLGLANMAEEESYYDSHF